MIRDRSCDRSWKRLCSVDLISSTTDAERSDGMSLGRAILRRGDVIIKSRRLPSLIHPAFVLNIRALRSVARLVFSAVTTSHRIVLPRDAPTANGPHANTADAVHFACVRTMNSPTRTLHCSLALDPLVRFKSYACFKTSDDSDGSYSGAALWD